MKKILLHFGLGLTLIWNSVTAVHAETDPKMTFFLDCNTIQKQVNVGFISNPDDPNNGPAIIAFKYVLTLSASGTSTPADIANAIAVKNPALSNLVVAENKSEKVGDNVLITIAGGFTGGSGLPKSDYIFSLEGTNQASFLATVTTGELYAQNSTSNSYTKTGENFNVDPATCSSTTTSTTTTTTTPDNTSTTTSTDSTTTTSSTTSTSGTTTITITTDKASASAGQTFILTAIITNRNNQSVDWSQVSGGRIDQPTIENAENADGTTTSKFTAKMPVGTTADLVFKLNVGEAEERITVAAEDLATAAAAPDATPDTTPSESGKTLAELLEERRAELSGTTPNNATQPGNVHAAAGGLSKSGPEDLVWLLLGSFVIVMGWKRLSRSEV